MEMPSPRSMRHRNRYDPVYDVYRSPLEMGVPTPEHPDRDLDRSQQKVSSVNTRKTGMADSVANYIGAGVTIVVSLVGSIVAYVRASTRADVRIDEMQKDIDEVKLDIKDTRDAIQDQLRDMNAIFKNGIDGITAQFGESLVAFRQKITDIEMWNRDNFVRKEDFRDVIASFNRSVESLRASNQANFDRLLDKIDNINQDQSHR